VNRHYLDAMLTADRMADIQRAVSQPAALNQDFSPMLYYYHLRHWMSQFTLSFGVLQTVLLLLLLVYLIRLRGPALVLLRRASRDRRWRLCCCWPSRFCAARSIIRSA